jgi:hypothetical protein
MTSRLAFVLVAIVTLAGCRAVPGDVVVTVRNLSPGAVTLTTETPGAFLFSNTNHNTIQPWKKGVCFARIGIDRGHIKVTVSGSNVPEAATYETTVEPGGGQAPLIGVQIEPDGRVEFGVAIPDDELPCVGGGY